MDADSWDVIGAGWKAETIRTDAWNYTQKKRRDLAQTMYDMLQPEAKMRIQARRWDHENNWIDFEDMVLAEAAAEVPRNPTKYGTLPLSREQFDQRINKERLDELNEAQTVLDQPGGGLSEFVGASARAMTDQTSLMMMPFGLTGSAWRTIAGEAAMGGLGEAAVLPREFEVAEELGIEKPDPASRILTGMALGGVLSAGVLGVVKGAGLLHASRSSRAAALRDAKPEGVDALDFEVGVEEAEARLRGDRTVQEVVAPKADASTLGAVLGRAASARAPETVPIGYELQGKTRDKPVSDDFLSRLQASVAPLGDDIGVIITSGGQDRKGTPGGKRTGSTRHDVDATGHSDTADVVLTRNGVRVRPGEDKELYARFFHRAASLFPGIGHYDWGVHVGGGSVAAWGPTTTTRSLDPYFRDAIEAGRIGQTDWRPGAAYRSAPSDPAGDVPGTAGYTTQRGYTGTGQVTAGDEFRIDVEYEVVDLASIFRASGDMQPRDRSRGSSDAWIADTAARLDPAQLMPSPTADRGAPIVGPDGMIESGNGRFGAIERAYARHPLSGRAHR